MRRIGANRRTFVLDHLAGIRLPGPGWLVPHPLHVAVVIR
jgi:hypothetical protein